MAFPAIALDSDVFAYFVEANAGGYDPNTDAQHVAPQKVAAYRLYLYVGPSNLYIVPTVADEQQQHPHPVEQRDRAGKIVQMFREVNARDIDATCLQTRTVEYHGFHQSGLNDCRGLAEAECAGATRLLTFDKKFRRRLAGKTRTISILTPTELWDELHIPPGTTPVVAPAIGHPLYGAGWWKW